MFRRHPAEQCQIGRPPWLSAKARNTDYARSGRCIQVPLQSTQHQEQPATEPSGCCSAHSSKQSDDTPLWPQHPSSPLWPQLRSSPPGPIQTTGEATRAEQTHAPTRSAAAPAPRLAIAISPGGGSINSSCRRAHPHLPELAGVRIRQTPTGPRRQPDANRQPTAQCSARS